MNNCQVFTSDKVVCEMLDSIGYTSNVYGKSVLENSFGVGNFLDRVVRRYISSSLKEGHTPSEISDGLSKDIFGFEIDSEKFNTTVDRLNKILHDFKIPGVKWSLCNADYLKHVSKRRYDFIVGNPPYIDYRDLNPDVRIDLRRFSTCKKGKFDYCYPFIEKSITELADFGKMCYIVPNSIFKNVFSFDLREFLKSDITDIIKISNSAFEGKPSISPVIFIIEKGSSRNWLNYLSTIDSKPVKIPKSELGDKWTFVKTNKPVYKKKIRFGDRFHASLAMVTMCNEAFLIKDGTECGGFVELNDEKLESGILRKAMSPKTMFDPKSKHIIFPYIVKGTNVKRYKRETFEKRFPNVVKHLNRFEKKLSQRDTDKGIQYFEYGRSQGLKYANVEKLLMSTVITNIVRVSRIPKDSIPYSGIVITSKGGYKLKKAEKILRSSEFINYVMSIGVSVSGNSVRITSKDINNFEYEGGKEWK